MKVKVGQTLSKVIILITYCPTLMLPLTSEMTSPKTYHTFGNNVRNIRTVANLRYVRQYEKSTN